MLQGAKSYLQTSALPNDHTTRCDRQCLHKVIHQRRNNLLSLMSLMMLMILLTLLQSPFTTAQVPNDLPAILSLIYSNIPEIKAGSDSRIGFGYAIGNQADFQILFELGPQKFTKPLGNQEKSKESSKRQVNRLRQRPVTRNEANNKKTQSAWLEKWSTNTDVTSKKKVSTKDVTPKKPVVNKPDLVQLLPPQISHQVMQQLPKLHKMAKASTTEESVSKESKAPDAAASLLPEIIKVPAKEPATTKDLQVPTQKPQHRKKAEVTKELMDGSLDE